ncbi:MAG: hypothetical protein JXR97_05010 [Planctomycetes bacterium]|nr:hypothetical protein [Planctomycetota bacterium]
MLDVKKALEEIIESLSDSPEAQIVRNEIEEVIASGDKGRMKEALRKFDTRGTVTIQRLRKDD